MIAGDIEYTCPKCGEKALGTPMTVPVCSCGTGKVQGPCIETNKLTDEQKKTLKAIKK